ncbi:MAG: hypothetical protein J1D87_05705 [Lachnospiraceae bacterium]|nr:hypothetical protein [Lachnospiraceae bacterium]
MKEEMITLRLTSVEKQTILSQANLLNISASQYIRQILNSYNFPHNSICGNVSKTTQNICNLLTEIQKLKLVHPEIDFYEIERRASELCQW